ncbi:N-acetyltransferase [Chitinibacter sp. SCUT-21]|uniref:GNAT family N-acetyltransferase n=1 Tax=Chitinibacter sp. SCUT-21 TaxID=2970891 RepID=UPI0035A7327D
MELEFVAESPTDAAQHRAVTELLQQAFANHPYSNNSEHQLVTALRQQQALTIALLGVHQGHVVACVYASAVNLHQAEGIKRGWHCIAPVAVLPEFQKQGLGSQLMNRALVDLQSMGAKGCVLVGEAEYYQRFGFERVHGLTSAGIPDQFVLAKSFAAEKAQGQIQYHPAFASLEA